MEQFNHACVAVWLGLQAAKQRLRDFHQDESGMATIEVILIIVVLIALVIMFKDVIIDFVSGLLDNISNQGDVFDPDTLAQ